MDSKRDCIICIMQASVESMHAKMTERVIDVTDKFGFSALYGS